MAESDSNVEIPWLWVAAGSSTISLGALTTLVIIASVQKVDTLSTVALALAVIAFTAQLGLALWQGLLAQAQAVQAERFNSETKAILAELRTSARHLSRTQSGQFDRLLESVLTVVPAAVQTVTFGGARKDVPPSELARDITTAIKRAAVAEIQQVEAGEKSRGRAEQGIHESLMDFYNTYPEEKKGRELVTKLRSLDPLLAAFLGEIAADEISRIRFGLPLPFRIAEGGVLTEALVKAGIAVYCDPPTTVDTDDCRWVVLTEYGRDLIRVVVAPAPSPPWLGESVREFRRNALT
jgi:hypothetical protein